VGFQARVAQFQLQVTSSLAFVHVAEIRVAVVEDIGDAVACAEFRIEVELGKIEQADTAMAESHARRRHGEINGPTVLLVVKGSCRENEGIHAGVDYAAAISIVGRWSVGVGNFPDIPVSAIEKQVVQKQAKFLGGKLVHRCFGTALAPELDNVIANLELMPLRLNEGKGDQIGDRQISMAKAFRDAGLLSEAGFKQVIESRQ
jgi:hypothetical protein